MAEQPQPDELGSYAFFRQQGYEPHPDSIDDGSIAMHHREVLHDENDSGRALRFAEHMQYAPDVHIVEEDKLLGGAVKRRHETDADTAADLWMKKHGHKW